LSVQESIIRVDGATGLVGSEIPFYIYGNPELGPTVSIMAGVHGCEYVPMLALRQFLDDLDETQLKGSLRVVPMANIASFQARTAFVVPHDGLNLNRCFPGTLEGSFTERLAYALFHEAIAPAQYHVDMHAGDQVEALEPFAIYDVSSVEEASSGMAHAYGLPYVIRTERSGSPIAGTSSAAAAEAGIASITAEVGGRGLVDDVSVARHLEGLRRLLTSLGVLPATFPDAPAPVEIHHWVWLRSTTAGWWSSRVDVGQWVEANEIIGTVRSLDGANYEEIIAPEAGVPLFLTTSPAVAVEGLLLGLGVR
jgi:predicted deacylase